jgi:hypothetical protein
VPVLNVATVLGWGGFSPWLILIGLFPVLGPIALWVLVIISAHRITPGFGYGGGMTVLAAVLFVVWASILGFGPARWLGARAGGMSAHRREQTRASLGGVFAEPAPMTPEAAVVSALPPAAVAEPAHRPTTCARTTTTWRGSSLLPLPPPRRPGPRRRRRCRPPRRRRPPRRPRNLPPHGPRRGTVAVEALDEPVATSSPPPSAVVRPPAPAPVSASAAVRAGEATADDDAACCRRSMTSGDRALPVPAQLRCRMAPRDAAGHR